MAPQVIRLPDGQNFTVTPVFAGLGFKSHELNTPHSAFPIGWTVVLNTEEQLRDDDDKNNDNGNDNDRESNTNTNTNSDINMDRDRDCDEDDDDRHGPENGDGVALDGGNASSSLRAHKHHSSIHSFSRPTLQGDNLFISSIANPSSSDYKPAASPTRQIAMMLWITLYWYFHQPEPEPYTHPDAARATPFAGKPRGEWRINIKRDGVLRGRNLIPKLERMGLIASADTAVGTGSDDSADAWAHMFVSRQMFWQLPGRLFLFSLAPNPAGRGSGAGGLSSFPGSPISSRPGSPIRGDVTPNTASFRNSYHSQSQYQYHQHYRQHSPHTSFGRLDADLPGSPAPTSITPAPNFPLSPFYSTSHLPTYYPPPPLQYVFTNNVRHPLRPKPPRMGEVFYTRFVPSVGQYLSFRVASLSDSPVPYFGPIGPKPHDDNEDGGHTAHLTTLNDAALLQLWMAKPRVSEFWNDYSPDFLANALRQKHSFPVIGQWDGVPFGYFEVYWVKEDILGHYLGGDAAEWDRGLHVLIGEEWARGRVPIWLSSLVHWCLTSDYRTMNVALEPRVDNARFLQRLEFTGFSRERQISFPHKQSWYVRMRREEWDGPSL